MCHWSLQSLSLWCMLYIIYYSLGLVFYLQFCFVMFSPSGSCQIFSNLTSFKLMRFFFYSLTFCLICRWCWVRACTQLCTYEGNCLIFRELSACCTCWRNEILLDFVSMILETVLLHIFTELSCTFFLLRLRSS